MNFEDLLPRFKGVKGTGVQRVARCPAHVDEKASLSIKDDGAKILVHCHAHQCTPEEIMSAIGLSVSDLFRDPKTKKSRSESQIEALYDYRDENGALLYQVCRKRPKGFSQRRPDGADGWIWKMGDVRRVLYQLTNLLSADVSKPVLILEGEKDVLAAETHGFVATCNVGGAGKWRDEYSEALRGRVAVTIPDNDDPGRAHAETVCKSLHSKTSSLKVINLPGLPQKGDLSDWFAAGHTADELMSLINAAPEWSPPPAEPSAARPGSTALSEYGFDKLGMFHKRKTKDGLVDVRLTNFTARVLREVTRDDGAELRTVMEIEALLNGRKVVGRATPSSYRQMNWPTELLGASAVIYPGKGEHARCAVSLISGEIPKQTIFTHTGWRDVDGEMVYLHAGGAISARDDVSLGVELDGPLSDYRLPDPPSTEEWREAMRYSLLIVDLMNDAITIPALGAVWDAVLGGADYSVFIEGGSGQRKSAFTAVLQSFWGSEFNGDRMPANWEATANANAEKQHSIKDALLCVDDYKPPSDAKLRARREQDAERIFRGAANHSGRGRMNADGTLRPEKSPRCLTMATGEDVPPGQSLRARMLILRIPRDVIRLDLLSECQRLARAGVFARAMAGYLRWLIPRIARWQHSAAEEIATLRDALSSVIPGHGRTPTTIARLQRAWDNWLLAACECGAITEESSYELAERIRAALLTAGNEQSTYQRSQDPAPRFVELLVAAIASGRAHIVDAVTGGTPKECTAWGWRSKEFATSNGPDTIFEAKGETIGWLNGSSHVYLQPDAAYQVAQRMAGGSDAFAVSQQTLWRRLDEAGMLAARDKEHLSIKKTIGDSRRRVIVLKAELLGFTASEQPKEGGLFN